MIDLLKLAAISAVLATVLIIADEATAPKAELRPALLATGLETAAAPARVIPF